MNATQRSVPLRDCDVATLITVNRTRAIRELLNTRQVVHLRTEIQKGARNPRCIEKAQLLCNQVHYSMNEGKTKKKKYVNEIGFHTAVEIYGTAYHKELEILENIFEQQISIK